MDDNSFREKIKEIVIIARKELMHCLRDTHVIIYSLILPVVFYPLIIIGASEFALWREGLTERQPIKVCIDQKSKVYLPELSKLIKQYKKIVEVNSDSPMQDLKIRRLDCYIVARPDLSGMIAYLNPSNDRHLETRVFITTIASHAKSRATAKVLKESGMSKKSLEVYSVKLNSLAEFRMVKKPEKLLNKYAMIKSIVIGILCVYTLVIIQSGTVYPALTAFTLEIEKKTILTTQLIPVEPWHLIIGKFLSVLTISTTTAIINLSSLAFVVLYFLVKMPWSREFIDRTVNNISLNDVLAVLVVFALSVVLLSSIYCFVASIAKSFKEAQNISSLILITTMLLPAVAMIPGITLTNYTVWIPFSNLVLAAKGVVTDEFSPLLLVFSLLWNFLIALSLLYLSKLSFYGALPRLFKKLKPQTDRGT